MGDWNSDQYLMFKNERTQPAIDLVNRITVKKPKKIIDIGCGPGNSTKVLKDRFPNAYILGVDSSPNMIEKAKETQENIEFTICDIEKDIATLPNDFDIVFSNACIQWISNHHKLLKNLMGLLKKDGILAIQMPMNYEEPIHRLIGEVTTNNKWKSKFNDPRFFYPLKQDEYFDLLDEISTDFSVWETIYYHKLESHEAIMEWYRGTGLRPYLNVLSNKNRVEFENDVLNRVKDAYPFQKGSSIIFRFPRLFFIARK